MKKEINFSVVSGTLILIWLVFSPVLGLVLHSYFNKYLNIPIAYILITYLILGLLFYWFGKYLNNKLKMKGYSKKEIIIPKNQTITNSKYGFWSLKVNSVEHANKIINDTAWFLWFLGVIYFVLSFFVMVLNLAWIDGLLLVFFGSMLAIKRNTWVSIVVLILGILTLVETFINKIKGGGGGTNILLVFIFLWATIQSFLAIKYIKENSNTLPSPTEKIKQKHRKIFLVSAWISGIVFALFTILLFISYYGTSH